mgnify:CR=1 FL=1
MNHNEGSALSSILEGGIYRVNFNTNITSATAGQVGLALFADGVQVPGTEMDETIATAGEFANIGFDKITDHERTLRRYLVEQLSKINHINIVNEESDSGVVAFNVDGIFPQDVAVYLNKYGICLRAGNHCAKILKNEIGVKNTLRASIYIYNTKEEIDKLISLLQDKNKILDEML